jgi:lysophospholipase L1-like esterase
MSSPIFSQTPSPRSEREPASSAAPFYFGAASLPAGSVQVLPEHTYSRERGNGFEPGVGAVPVQARSSVCSDKPFLFSVALPEGNYEVTLILGDRNGASATTVKAESRRLMLEDVRTAAGHFETRKFAVNVRTPQIVGDSRVQLKTRELASLDWDEKLTLEFNGTRPCVSALQIARANDVPTVYIAGDSTVVDQTSEPWAAWGQMLPRFFGPGIAISNHAESGESLKSFISERRLDKILSTIRRGDYLLIQFAHNDQKPGRSHVGAFTTYKAYLKVYAEEARERGAIPVFVTSMHRRSFDADGKIKNTLLDYPEAMRQAAREENVALIDLNAMSKVLFETLGPQASIKAFVHYPAGVFPGQNAPLNDDTHFSPYGGYELARCVAEGIRTSGFDLAKFLVPGVPFDPAHPDAVESFKLPASPFVNSEIPLGSR